MLKNRDEFSTALINEQSVLIGGTTGSGKSVLVSNIVYTLSHEDCELYLVDPKRVELSRYSGLEQCKMFSSTSAETLLLMRYVNDTMNARYEEMETMGETEYWGTPMYVIIDELVDLSPRFEKDKVEKDNKLKIESLLIRIATLGRASGIHLIACTQRPTQDVITGAIKGQFTARVGLRTATPNESRNIVDVKCCEELPLYGYCYYRSPKLVGLKKTKIDRIIWTPPTKDITKRAKGVRVPNTRDIGQVEYRGFELPRFKIKCSKLGVFTYIVLAWIIVNLLH